MLSKKPRITEVETYSTIEDFEPGDRVYRLGSAGQSITRATVLDIKSGSMFLSLDTGAPGVVIEVMDGNTGEGAEDSTIAQWGKILDCSTIEEGITLSTLLPEYAPDGERVYGTVLEFVPGKKLILEDQEYPYSTVTFEPDGTGASLEDMLAGWEAEG